MKSAQHRLLAGIGLSVLLHGIVLFSIQENLALSGKNSMLPLQVRLEKAQISKLADEHAVLKTAEQANENLREQSQNGNPAHTEGHGKIRAHLILRQLKKLLTLRLSGKTLTTGSCKLLEFDDPANNRLKCDSSAVHEILYRDQQTIIQMILALREFGYVYHGFSAENQDGKLKVNLLEDDFNID